MHKLAIARLSALVLFVSLALPFALLRVSAAQEIVSVLYAGSLVTPMEGPVKAALLGQGIAFEGQPGGSKELANLIASGVRSPDVFISVNPALVKNLGDKVASATTFAGTSLGVAWAPTSKYAAVFERAAKGDMPLQDALETPDLRIGRTDPKLDPKGAYTITGVKMWLGDEQEQHLLGPEENPAQIFPEEDLLARVDTGQVDVGFFYRTEAIARKYPFIPLPGNAALTDRITYTLAIMKAAPHPQTAKTFADFILTGGGRDILTRAGITYLK